MQNLDVIREVGIDDLAPVRIYLDVISSSNDPNEVFAVSNLYNTVFHIDPPSQKSWEMQSREVGHAIVQANREESRQTDLEQATVQIADLLGGKNKKVYSPEEHLLHTRVNAVTHVVRHMVQGNLGFPVERFEEVIDMCVKAIMGLDPSITPKKAKRHIRYELKEIWELRSAEALNIVGAPSRLLAYKIGSNLVALVSRSSKESV
jgi:hypothetical protein